ncbi:MAG TPA: hypothetical protein VF158_04195 [Longimicrobiales bacterium]
MHATFRAAVLGALAVLGAAACRPGDTDLAAGDGAERPAAEGVGPGARIEVEPAPRERRQAAPPGDAVAVLREGADVEVTIYDPPPDLSRPELGVVYIPAPPPSSPASGAGDTVGVAPLAPPAPSAPAPGDTMGVRRP